MADDFGKDTHYGLTGSDIVKAVDDNPAPNRPEPPKPPVGWESKSPSYGAAHETRKANGKAN